MQTITITKESAGIYCIDIAKDSDFLEDAFKALAIEVKINKGEEVLHSLLEEIKNSKLTEQGKSND